MTTATSSIRGRIDEVIRDYDAQGFHRTATPTDDASAQWLAEQVRDRGLDPTLEPFPLDRIDPRSCFVEVGGRRIEGLPAFDGALTDGAGVSGTFGPAASAAPIALLDAPVNGPAAGGYRDARRSGRHAAIVAVTRGRRPGLAMVNAPSFDAPFGPPVLLVSSEEGGWLAEQAARGVAARVVVEAARTPAQAFNVVARLPGRDPSLAPLVVMTPRSGWWQCASERGGGIVCWLEVMRALRERGSARDVHFLASSGHELGHHGLKAFMAARPALARAALAWIHFGANIGAAEEGGGRIAASDDELRGLAVETLLATGAPAFTVAPPDWVPAGEAHNVHDAGGRYLSLVGGNARFHLESDRWPEAIDAEAIEGFARAFAAVATKLT